MDEIAGFLKFKHLVSASTNQPADEDVLREYVLELPQDQNPDALLQTGRWTLPEQLQYLRFIETHRSYLACKEQRRSAKIFKMMARFIRTRGPDQCRSHHQKMQKKYDSIANIIANCQKNLSKLKKPPEAQQLKLSVTATDGQVQITFLKAQQVSQEPEKDKLVQPRALQERILFQDQKCHSPFEEIEPPSVNQLLEINQDNLEMFLWDTKKY